MFCYYFSILLFLKFLSALLRIAVSRYKNEDARRAIIRMEQCARSSIQRAIGSRGALAILNGRHSKHYIRKAEVLFLQLELTIEVRNVNCRPSYLCSEISVYPNVNTFVLFKQFFCVNILVVLYLYILCKLVLKIIMLVRSYLADQRMTLMLILTW